jgi:hypothetical protein
MAFYEIIIMSFGTNREADPALHVGLSRLYNFNIG